MLSVHPRGEVIYDIDWCLRLCSHYTGSIFGPLRKSIRYNVNNAQGIEPHRTGLELSCSHCTGSICFIFAFVWQKKPSLKPKRVITRFCSQNGADPLNSPFTLGAECSKKRSDMERITFRIGVLQVIIVTKIVSDQLDQV